MALRTPFNIMAFPNGPVCNLSCEYSAFAGIRAAVVGLVAGAAVRIGKEAISHLQGLAIALGAFILTTFDLVPVIWIILSGGLAGYALHLAQRGTEA